MQRLRERLKRFGWVEALILFAVVGCLAFVVIGPKDPAFRFAVERDHPHHPAEKVVAAELVRCLPGIQFRRWGPHFGEAESLEIRDWPGGERPQVVVRVVFTWPDGKEDATDWVYGVKDERLFFIGWNKYGDGWKEEARRGSWPKDLPKPPTVKEALEENERRNKELRGGQ